MSRFGAFAIVALPFALLANPAAAQTTSTGPMGSGRDDGPVAAPLFDGRVVVAAGRDPGGNALSSAEVYSLTAGSFSSAGIGSMSIARLAPAAAPLPNGRVLVAGGANNGTIFSSAEVFDRATGAFTASGIGAMGTPRFGAVAAPLPDGRVLVAGGYNGSQVVPTAEIFDPATNTFSASGVGSMSTPRENAVAAPLGDGRVLVAGGFNGTQELSTAEVFDPASKQFTSVASMSTPRASAMAAPLLDGRAVVIGGSGSPPLRSVETFSPASNAFSPAPALPTGRAGAAAAPLPDGRILVAGGFDEYYGNTSSSAFIYDATAGSVSPPAAAPQTGGGFLHADCSLPVRLKVRRASGARARLTAAIRGVTGSSDCASGTHVVRQWAKRCVPLRSRICEFTGAPSPAPGCRVTFPQKDPSGRLRGLDSVFCFADQLNVRFEAPSRRVPFSRNFKRRDEHSASSLR